MPCPPLIVNVATPFEAVTDDWLWTVLFGRLQVAKTVALAIAAPCSSLTVTLPLTKTGLFPFAAREILVERRQSLVQPAAVGVALGPGFAVALGSGVAVAMGPGVALALAVGVVLGSGMAVELGVGVGRVPLLLAERAYT